jgi:CRP/FNR family cyclic AMP-dependent transcriptional regulator
MIELSQAAHESQMSQMSQTREPRPRPALSPIDILRGHPIFGKLPPNILEQLATYVTRRRVKRGSALFAKGDPGTGLMAVLSGTVKISVPSADGHEVVLNLIRAGELFGEIALLDGRPRTADATAMDDCELMVIDRRDFIPFVKNQPNIALNLIEILCARLRHTSEQVEDLMFLSLPARLAKTLLKLANRSDSDKRSATFTITQRELSQMIGMSRESTNKQLRAWEKRNWVRLGRGTLTIVNAGALAEISEDGADYGNGSRL